MLFRSWYIEDIFIPTILSFLIVFILKILFNKLAIENQYIVFIYILMSGLFALLASVLATKTGRIYLSKFIRETKYE